MNAKDDKHLSIFPLYLRATQMGQSSCGAVTAPDMALSFLTPTLCARKTKAYKKTKAYSLITTYHTTSLRLVLHAAVAVDTMPKTTAQKKNLFLHLAGLATKQSKGYKEKEM